VIRYSLHANEQIEDRRIERIWVEIAITVPDWTEADPNFPERTRCYKAIAEVAGRVLRVVHQRDDDDIMVITAHFDRSARRRQRR
jgi:hypothetical protein